MNSARSTALTAFAGVTGSSCASSSSLNRGRSVERDHGVEREEADTSTATTAAGRAFAAAAAACAAAAAALTDPGAATTAATALARLSVQRVSSRPGNPARCCNDGTDQAAPVASDRAGAGAPLPPFVQGSVSVCASPRAPPPWLG